jgi:hypothetical protein
MAENKHTLSDVLKRLVVDIDNMNSFLFSLRDVLESQSENVSIDQKKEDGTSVKISVPSFGYLKGKVDEINTNLDTLLSANNNVIGLKSANGDVRKFELKKTSQLIAELEAASNLNITIPTGFKVKNNWFFESFLNPLLYVSLDVSSILTDDIDRFAVKRIILNAADDSANDYFDANYRGESNIDLTTLKKDLNDNSFDYFEDDNIVELDIPVNRYKGSFDVLNIIEETINQTLTSGTTVTVNRLRYKLSTLTFTDVLSDISNSRTLAVGDTLITANDSEYKVTAVNTTESEVVLERTFGLEPINIGANVLRLKPNPYRVPELPVNVGFNEREIIFIRPISKAQNLTIDEFSNGVALYTNELTIPLQDNSTTTLERYYNNFVSDFGLILLNLAKEKTIPSILGTTPDAPVLDLKNFSVVQIDQHIQDDKNINDLNNNIKEKAGLQKEIDELNKKIDSVKSNIISVAKTPKESLRLKKQLTDTQKARDEKTAALSTLVTNISLQLSTNPQFITPKTYRIRGFWQIPIAKSSQYGEQQVVQFKYRYRYLSASGNQPNSQQQTFLDVDGSTKQATFSSWTEVLTTPRKREINENTGLYKWSEEVVTDADAVNSNQLDIPIRKGEIVEVQIKSISEAGWPTNPVESVWSESVQIPFPESIQSEEDGAITSQKAFADKTKIDFENSLSSMGLDTHLASQFNQNGRFFSHVAEDIASGFYTSEGNVVDLYEKLKSVQTALDAIQQSIATDLGAIKVSIIDTDGNQLDVANGDTVNLFAGYYRDLIKDTTGGTVVYREGNIITKQYAISIQNTSATNLELISLLFGGLDQTANSSDPVTNPDQDYHVNRRYDIVPIGVNSNPTPIIGNVKHLASTQSAQVRSQFINSRVRNYGLSEEIYAPSNTSTGYSLAATYATGSSNAYRGQTISSTLVPYNWGHYLPFNPNYAVPGTTVNPKVWNGTTSASGVPQGGGYLTEFCISPIHPELKNYGNNFNSSYLISNITNKFRPNFTMSSSPAIDTDSPQSYLPFAHALHMETSVSELTNAFGVDYYKQASRVNPTTPTLSTSRDDSNYPIKLGFTPNDKYLIGKYTCGSYLYMFPTNYESVSVEGNFPARSTKTVKLGAENALNIPVIFQFRCSDSLGFIGGFRTSSALTNIKYTKKMGVDIILKDGSPFSFDLQASAQYTKETAIDSPIVQGKGITVSF